MQTATYGNGNGMDDLYILPENEYEKQAILDWLDVSDRSWAWSKSNVPDQSWSGRWFFDIPFGEPLLLDLIALASKGGAE